MCVGSRPRPVSCRATDVTGSARDLRSSPTYQALPPRPSPADSMPASPTCVCALFC
ncbi:hypothetical protein BDA96_06G099500 [Sorghum bicolor]|nr:hypothetical protein BDA96_06G099500 [Sorghum bicolor]